MANDTNMFIMVGLGMAGLWFMNRQRGSQEDQVDQLAGAAMMASGEGTAPDAPFQAYSAPANPIFFFNQGGQMTKVPGTNIPFGASSGEDIGVYPGGLKKGELEFTVEKTIPAVGTSDTSLTTEQFEGSAVTNVTASTIWDQEALIASANFMPLLALQDTGGGTVKVLGSNVDISTLSSKEAFRAVNLDTGFAFTTSAGVLQEYVQGFIDYPQKESNGPGIVIGQTVPNVPIPILGGSPWIERQEWDLDIGI